MQLRIDRDVFSAALGKMQGIVEKRTTQAMLSHVLLQAGPGGTLELAATDLDVTLQGRYPAEVGTEGAVCAAARNLYEIVRALPPGEVSLATAENHYLEIRSGAVEYHIVGAAAEQFPSLPSTEGEGVELPRQLFVELIDAVHFSISTDDTRPNLNGALVKSIGGGKLMMVSTDGHRLSKAVRDVGVELPDIPEDGTIVPRKGLLEVRKILDAGSETFRFAIQGTSAVFRSENEVLVVRLIEGAFPDFDKVIQKESRLVGVVERMNFIDAVHRVSLVSTPRTGGIRIQMTGERLRILAHNPDLGEAHEDVPVEMERLELPPNKEQVEIGYNSGYLREALNALSSDEVTYETNDSSAPTILRNRGEEESFYVVMPMRF